LGFRKLGMIVIVVVVVIVVRPGHALNVSKRSAFVPSSTP
jgi:hypothetical protein